MKYFTDETVCEKIKTDVFFCTPFKVDNTDTGSLEKFINYKEDNLIKSSVVVFDEKYKIILNDRDNFFKKNDAKSPDRIKEATGTVVEYNNEIVRCKIRLKNKNIEINIPRKLFSFDIFNGLEVGISINKTSSYSFPVVRKISFSPKNDYIRKKANDILENF